jgi:hypothetical protein
LATIPQRTYDGDWEWLSLTKLHYEMNL